ncbi:MAG TPA: UvrD-helicase domain-containing protein [Bryobacteraceae bacterium]|nr:UvrD-helicase domain-containing protein [Bryobacteraceae bacterium]
MNLSSTQRQAIERLGQNVCVMAGPGSGKTRVLIERFAWLVEQHNFDPQRILAITFTEKAATEIKERLIKRFAHMPDLREQIERAWVSTIHGFCARLLRENAIAAGLAPDLAVLDASTAERMAREAADESLEDLYQEQPDQLRRLLEALDLSTQDDGRQPDLARGLLSVSETMRLSGTTAAARLAPHDSLPEALDLVRAVIADSTVGKTVNQRPAHSKLKQWSTDFLDKWGRSPAGHTANDFKSLRFDINLSHLVQGSPSRRAASELKNTLLPRLESEFLEAYNHDLMDLLHLALKRIDQRYREKKRRDAVLDFTDLEEQAIRLLESNPAVRQETAGRFDEILMDELQDTNRLQWRLIDLIRKKLYAVGDINQSIYSFRHAEPAVFAEYRDSLIASGFEIDDLRENHRSFAEILETVSGMLDTQPGIEPRPLIASRGSGATVERLVGRGENGADVEAGLVAARIRELVDSRQYDFRDVAILVRALSATEAFERSLDRFGIPFLVSGGRTFLEARETRDLLALLAALVNPLDEIALVGVLRSPLAGMSDEEIFRIGREGWSKEFEATFGNLRRQAGFVPPDLILASAMDDCGYAERLPERAGANIEKLLAHVRREHRDHPRPLAELLEELEARRVTQSEAEAPPAEAGNLVRLMSIHAAKGLEFKVVFVSALHQGPNRSRTVITFSRAAGLGARWRNPATGKGQSDTAHAIAIAEIKQKEEAEENRLLYVAMTRAQDRLFLSYAEKGRASGWQKLAEAAISSVSAADQVPDPSELRVPVAVDTAVEQLLDPPNVTGQFDSSAAITSIALFHACPRKYYLSLFGRGQAREGGEGGGVATGLAVHKILADDIEGIEEEMELAARFRNSPVGKRAARANRMEREFDFLLPIHDVVLRGQIDLWFEEGGELILVDYKTDRDESGADRYALQLGLYSLALEKYAGRLPDRAILFYVRSAKEVEVSIDRTALDAARAAVQAFRDAQESSQYPLAPSEACRRCEFYQNRCPVNLP